MRSKIAIAIGVLLACAWYTTNATAQPVPCDACEMSDPALAPCDACESCGSAPCETCESSGPPPCGCTGHRAGCCCAGICTQSPNPLAPGRPSPPPCCADGICYPNYETWGHYKTRWRPWPIQLAATTPGAPSAAPAVRPGVPTYEVLPPEEEDRRAPPPSAPRGKPVEIAPRKEAPSEGARETTPGAPAAPTSPTAPIPPQESPGAELTPESIFGLPPEETGPGGTPPTTAPTPGAPVEETPGTTPLAPPAGGGPTPGAGPLGTPMGDEDRPPALPFAAPRLSTRPAFPATIKQPPAAAPKPKYDVRSAPQDDPPPALPSALASLSR